MRVLVTGAAGFVGGHLCAALREQGHTVIAAGHDAEWPVDFRIPELVAEVFREGAPDTIVHLAGTATAAERASGPVAVQTENIVHPLLNVLELAGERRVLFVSNALVYGSGLTEESAPLRPLDLYAAARASAETLALRRATKYAQNLVVVRPFMVLGPGLSPRSEVGGWLTRAAAGDDEIATQDLDRTRDLVDVRDVVLGFCVLLRSAAGGTVYNLASGRSVSLRTVFQHLCPGIRSVSASVVTKEPLTLVGGAERLRALGWAPRHDVEATLEAVTLQATARRGPERRR